MSCRPLANWLKANCHVVIRQNGAVRFLEIADHIRPHRRAIDRIVGCAARRRAVVTGWKDGRRSRAAPSWCAPARRPAGSTSRRRPQTSAPACTNTAAERGRCGTGRIYFSNFADGRLYRQAPDGSAPAPLTPEPPARDRQWRFADGVIDQRRNRWIGVREDHTVGGEPVNAIVAVDLDGRSARPARAGARARFLRLAATLARRKPGSPGWPGITPTCRGTARCSTLPTSAPKACRRAARNCRKRNRIHLPAGMVARRRAARVRVRPLGLVESLRLRPGGANHAGAGADGGGVRRAAMDVRDVELCLCQPRADRLRIYTGGARAPGRAGSRRRSPSPARHPVHRIRLGAGGGRPRCVSRRCARPPRRHRLPRSRLRATYGAEEGDRDSRSRRPAPRRLPDEGRDRGIPDHRRGDRV